MQTASILSFEAMMATPDTSPPERPQDKIGYQSRAQAILAFWFGEPGDPDYGHYHRAWFVKNADFDTQIRQQFLTDTEKAAAGEYDGWLATPETAVALLLLLDQFPRNLYRGSALSFATDDRALKVAQHLVDTGRFPHRNEILGRQNTPAEKAFLEQPGSRF